MRYCLLLSLFLLLIGCSARTPAPTGPQALVYGVVTDDSLHLPLLGVVISASTTKLPERKQGATGTGTNREGHYALLVPQDSMWLRFRFIGFPTVDTLLALTDLDSLRLDISLPEIPYDVASVIVCGPAEKPADPPPCARKH